MITIVVYTKTHHHHDSCCEYSKNVPKRQMDRKGWHVVWRNVARHGSDCHKRGCEDPTEKTAKYVSVGT